MTDEKLGHQPFKSEREVPFEEGFFFFNNPHTEGVVTALYDGKLPVKHKVAVLSPDGAQAYDCSKIPVAELVEKGRQSRENTVAILKTFKSEFSQLSIDSLVEMARTFHEAKRKDKVKNYLDSLQFYIKKNKPQLKAIKDFLIGIKDKLPTFLEEDVEAQKKTTQELLILDERLAAHEKTFGENQARLEKVLSDIEAVVETHKKYLEDPGFIAWVDSLEAFVNSND
jgi:ribosome assembly protein YihI (activator of Der GTPase)